MLKNKNIICISSIDWDFIWQQHQAIMSILAKNKNRILFIENTGVRTINIKDLQRLKKRFMNWRRSVNGFREEMKNLYIYSPLILPFPYFRIARWINKHSLVKAITRWAKVMEFNDPIIWTFLPTPIVLDLVEEIPHKAFVYYCTDNFAATSKSAQKVVKYEKKVIQKADAVFVMARNLLDYCLSFNNNVTCIPMGVETEIFMKSNTINMKPTEIKDVNYRIIGFVGGIRQTLNQTLLQYLAKRLSDFTFVFVGPIQAEISCIKQLKNIIFVGQNPPNCHKKITDNK